MQIFVLFICLLCLYLVVGVLRFCAGLHPSGGGTKHIETVQTVATASKVYIGEKEIEKKGNIKTKSFKFFGGYCIMIP